MPLHTAATMLRYLGALLSAVVVAADASACKAATFFSKLGTLLPVVMVGAEASAHSSHLVKVSGRSSSLLSWLQQKPLHAKQPPCSGIWALFSAAVTVVAAKASAHSRILLQEASCHNCRCFTLTSSPCWPQLILDVLAPQLG